MDQNNYYDQNPQNGGREPLPTMDYPQAPSNGYYGQNPQYAGRDPLPNMQYPTGAPVYQQAPTQQKNPALEAQLASYADAAFGKCLAACIMAWFPVTSIIAIVMGSNGLGIVQQAYDLAVRNGVSAGGKNIAAKILGKVGKIGGIAMTIFWSFYMLIIFAAAMSAM